MELLAIPLKELLLKISQLNQELNIFLLKKNILNMTELKEFKESHMKDKL